MKLSEKQALHVADQLSGQAIQDEHPSAGQLRDVAGDHTFFVNGEGLHVVEPSAASDGANGTVIQIGAWSDDQEGHLKLHEPRVHSEVKLEPEGGSD